MQRYRKLTTICAAAVLTLGLAACGGGSDNGDGPDTGMTDPTLEEQLAAEKAAREAAEQALRDKEEAEQKAADEAAAKELAATAKALHGALGTSPLGNLDRTTNPGGAVLVTSGLTIDQVQGSLDADPAAVELEAGDSAGALGSWNGSKPPG